MRKKIIIISILILIFINAIILFFNIYNNRYIDKLENKYISIEIPKNVILKTKRYNDYDSKFRFNSGNSTIDVILLNQIPSNDVYSMDRISRSIDYQVLNKLEKYNEIDFYIDGNISYSKNVCDDKIAEILVRYEKEKVLVISYVSYQKNYDSSLIKNMNSSIQIK